MENELLYWTIFETASDGLIIVDLETGKILLANPAAAEMHGYSRKEFCGLQFDQLVHSKNLSLFADFVQIIQQGGLFETITLHKRSDDSLINVDWRAVAVKYQNRTCALSLLRNVSKQIQKEYRLKQRMLVRAQEQSTLLEISQVLASTLKLQPDLILDQLRVLVKYTHAGLFALQDSTLVTLAVRGIDHLEQSLPFCIRLNGKQTLKALFNGHRPIRIANIWSDEPPAIFLRTLLENDSAALLKGVQSWMWVPLAVKNRIIGGIGVAHVKRNYFSPHYADLAMTIANQAAMALVNAELYEHAQALATLQERQRLAQNLHDAVNQSLFSAGLIAEVLPRLWERNPDEARDSLKDLRRLIHGAQAEMRVLLSELRPTTLIDTELGELLLLLSNAFSGRTNIPVELTVSGEGSYPADIQEALYRICQESLNNIAKHTKATQVEIELHHTTTGLRLLIRDNGCGFDKSGLLLPGHYGLNMMRERAEAVGAVFNINSQPNKGTEIVIMWGEQEGL